MVSVLSFKKKEDNKALYDYQTAISVDDYAEKQFEKYCLEHIPRPTTFEEFKNGFQKYVLELEKKDLAYIMKNQNLYRDYRAYVREHYVKQGKPWVIVYYEFYNKYMFQSQCELYKNFVVFNKAGKKKVLQFYKWLDKKSSKNKIGKSRTNYREKNKYNVHELENKAFELYSQKEMWMKLKKGENVYEWQIQLKSFVVYLIHLQLDIIKKLCGEYAKRNYYVYEISRVILRFHKCFHTIGFRFDEHEMFLKVCIRKGLEFANEGIPEGMYLLAKIFPDMICDDCCPWINILKKEYKNTDVPRLLENQLFYSLSWCHTFWSEEYHIDIAINKSG
jgi:hypothetical protein